MHVALTTPSASVTFVYCKPYPGTDYDNRDQTRDFIKFDVFVVSTELLVL